MTVYEGNYNADWINYYIFIVITFTFFSFFKKKVKITLFLWALGLMERLPVSPLSQGEAGRGQEKDLGH